MKLVIKKFVEDNKIFASFVDIKGDYFTFLVKSEEDILKMFREDNSTILGVTVKNGKLVWHDAIITDTTDISSGDSSDIPYKIFYRETKNIWFIISRVLETINGKVYVGLNNKISNINFLSIQPEQGTLRINKVIYDVHDNNVITLFWENREYYDKFSKDFEGFDFVELTGTRIVIHLTEGSVKFTNFKPTGLQTFDDIYMGITTKVCRQWIGHLKSFISGYISAEVTIGRTDIDAYDGSMTQRITDPDKKDGVEEFIKYETSLRGHEKKDNYLYSSALRNYLILLSYGY